MGGWVGGGGWCVGVFVGGWVGGWREAGRCEGGGVEGGR